MEKVIVIIYTYKKLQDKQFQWPNSVRRMGWKRKTKVTNEVKKSIARRVKEVSKEI